MLKKETYEKKLKGFLQEKFWQSTLVKLRGANIKTNFNWPGRSWRKLYWTLMRE